MDSDSDNASSDSSNKKHVKRRKPGIIYLSHIPSSMSVSKLREYFGKYGQIGRVYLQLADNKSSKNKRRPQFSEGWIEFKSKRKAKYAHSFINNTPVGGKKSNPDYDMLWNTKYLPRFKWDNLTQRLEYERQVYKKRMRAEIYQVNKEMDHFLKASFLAQEQKTKKVGPAKKGLNKSGQKSQNKSSSNKKVNNSSSKGKKLNQKEKIEKFRKLREKKKIKKQQYRNEKIKKDDFVNSVFVGSSSKDET